MNKIECKLNYISCSCNRYSHCIDWGNEFVIFATQYAIAVYDVQKCKIVNLLTGHNGQVNCVKWITKETAQDDQIISCSNDKTILIWERDINSNNNYDFIIKYKLVGHFESVIVVDAIKLANINKILTVSCSTDQTVLIWNDDEPLTKISFNNFIFDTKIINDSLFPNILIAFAVGEELFLYSYDGDKNLDLLIKLSGHEDWIRSIDIIKKNDSLMIASSSQDCFIRVHKMERTFKNDFQINEKVVTIKNNNDEFKYIIRLETVLAGHENWVNKVCWSINQETNLLNLLSSSMDKTMIIWEEPVDHNELWFEKVRVGEVGGDCLGLLGCTISNNGKSILAYSFNGALHLWKDFDTEWASVTTVGGHFDQVSDISWEPQGEYLLSTSFDQTTRLHSIWKDNDLSWHEIARPQIHGYQLNCISMINRLSFVCGADEKVLRIFKATKCFADSLKLISQICLSYNDNELAHSATVPSLGLSNRAIYEPSQIEHSFQPSVLNKPPTEDVLLQNTLWPETQKLYGHGYELFAVGVNHSGTLIASACKATKPEHANVILWDIKNAKQIGQLHSHQLTITQIRFSYDDQYILTVSRDRTWTLFQLSDDKSDFDYKRIAYSDKKNGIHSRIIWDCSWSFDSSHFITVSRDKTAVLWFVDRSFQDQQQEQEKSSSLGCAKPSGEILKLEESIMSVDIAPLKLDNNSYLIAFGLENGNLYFYIWNQSESWTLVHCINFCHQSIKKIRFSPKVITKTDEKELMIATCGNDNIVKIFTILLTHR